LFQYLIINNKIEDIINYNKEHMHITTDSVLEKIKRGEPGWEKLVPENVANIIKEKSLFGLPSEDTSINTVKSIHQVVGNV